MLKNVFIIAVNRLTKRNKNEKKFREKGIKEKTKEN